MRIKLPDSQLSQYRDAITRGIADAVIIAQWRCTYGKPSFCGSQKNINEMTLGEVFPGFENLNELVGAELAKVLEKKSVPVFLSDTVSSVVDRVLYTHDSEYRDERDYEVWISRVG